MDSRTKKALAIAGAGVLGIMLYLAYEQYKKIMSYTIKVTGKKIQKLSDKEIIFDLYLAFTNFSDIPIIVENQKYDVYVNNFFVTSVIGSKRTVIAPKATTTFPVRVSIVPKNVFKALGTNWASLLLQPEKLVINTEFQIKLALLGIGIPVRNSYPVTLAELLNLQKSGN